MHQTHSQVSKNGSSKYPRKHWQTRGQFFLKFKLFLPLKAWGGQEIALGPADSLCHPTGQSKFDVTLNDS